VEGIIESVRSGTAKLEDTAVPAAFTESALSRWHVVEKGVYRGPHLYSMVPLGRIQVDLGDLEHWPTHRLAGFSERLVALLPGLHNHG
jgi:cyanophycin synthetase